MQQTINNIINILSSARFLLNTEKVLQQQIYDKFITAKINFQREYVLDKKNIPDFFIDGIAVEVKLKGSAKNIYQQCIRYCGFAQVKSLILVTNRSMGFPQEINGKPCYLIQLGKSWL